MGRPRSRAAGLTRAASVLAVIVTVQVLVGPGLIESGGLGAIFLTAWSLGGMLVAGIPLLVTSDENRLATVAWMVAALTLLLGLALTLGGSTMNDTPAILGAGLLLSAVALRTRRDAQPATSAPLPTEPTPHLWS